MIPSKWMILFNISLNFASSEKSYFILLKSVFALLSLLSADLLSCLSFNNLKSLSYSALISCVASVLPLALSGWYFFNKSLYCLLNSSSVFTSLKYLLISDCLLKNIWLIVLLLRSLYTNKGVLSITKYTKNGVQNKQKYSRLFVHIANRLFTDKGV